LFACNQVPPAGFNSTFYCNCFHFMPISSVPSHTSL
jgi:hypothetical protein